MQSMQAHTHIILLSVHTYSGICMPACHHANTIMNKCACKSSIADTHDLGMVVIFDFTNTCTHTHAVACTYTYAQHSASIF